MPTEHLLPPNSTGFEKAMARAIADKIGVIPVPQRSLWNPQTCRADLLPWLAWALSIDSWNADWSEVRKRTEVARAIELQRRKGTPAALESVLARFDPLIRMLEWFEQDPPATPHTFQVIIPLDGEPLPRSTAVFARELVRDIYRIKPARSHFELWAELAADAAFFLQAAAWTMVYRRLELTAEISEAEGGLLLDDDGLPLLTDGGEAIWID